MNTREQTIQRIFQSWLIKDCAAFLDSFADGVVYVESWGPVYRNKAQINSWFTDWNRENQVLQWDIKSFFHVGDIVICEWYFKCECGGNVDGFDGVSIVKFDDADKIINLKEFASTTPNVYPYG